MINRKGGYVIVDLTSVSIYTDLQDAIAIKKPILLVDGTNTPFYATSVEVGDTTITLNGQVIIANDNTITGSFDLSALKYLTYDADNDEVSALKPVVELMEGYSFTPSESTASVTKEFVYAGVCKNGNKLTFVIAVNLTKTDDANTIGLGVFTIPSSIGAKLYKTQVGAYNFLDNRKLAIFSDYTSTTDVYGYTEKPNNTSVDMNITSTNGMTLNTKYYARYELTLLLSENLINEE